MGDFLTKRADRTICGKIERTDEIIARDGNCGIREGLEMFDLHPVFPTSFGKAVKSYDRPNFPERDS